MYVHKIFMSTSYYEISMYPVNVRNIHSVIFLYLQKAKAYIYSDTNVHFKLISK